MQIKFCEMKKEHYDSVKRIYKQAIDGGVSTFQSEPLEWNSFDSSHLKKCRIVAMSNSGEVCGWVALAHISIMEALRGVAELSIYVDHRYVGNGIGTAMMQCLENIAQKNGIWSLQSIILPENTRSLALHRKCGFREIGYRKNVAQMPSGIWKDVILFEKRL